MSGKVSAGLVAGLLVLCGIYGLWSVLEESAEQGVAEARRVFGFEVEDVLTLSVERAGEAPVEGLRGNGGTWSLVPPRAHIPANDVVWDRVAKAVAGLSNERSIEGGAKDLGTYGLEVPIVTVLAGTGTGELVQIRVGSLEPTQRYRYVRVGSGEVFLAQAASVNELARSLMELRDRRVVAVGNSGIRRLEFVRILTRGEDAQERESDVGAQGLELGEESIQVVVERSGEGWRMVEPFAGPANEAKVNALVTELQFAMGRNYVDEPENLSDYGLAPPGARVTVYGDEGDVGQTVLLGWVAGGEDGGLYVKRQDRPSVFVVDGHLLTLIPNSPNAFRGVRLLSREAKDLRAIRFLHGDGTSFALELDAEAGWRLTEPAVDDTDQTAVSRFISFLKNVEVATFPDRSDLAVAGFEAPRIVLELGFEGEEAPSRLVVGGLIPDSDLPWSFAMRDDGTLVTVPDLVVVGLDRRAFDFRKKRIFAFDRDKAREVALEFEGRSYVMRRVEGRWVVTEPADRMLESASDMEGLLDALCEVRAKGVVEGADDSGLEEVVLAVAVRVGPEGGAEDRVLGPLKVGKRAGEESRERFAMVEGRGDVYLVDQGLIDDVAEALRGVVPKG